MTIRATTAAVVRDHFHTWAARVGHEADDRVFAPYYRRAIHSRASLLSHRFVRFRHPVATARIGDGHLLKAQARLGHRDAATTLRHYAHATLLDDLDIADEPAQPDA